VRLSEELARILGPTRRTRRPADQAPREIVPGDATKAQRLDAARERLREQIPPRDDERE